jgi:predicted RND superfamily exporter protein
LDKFFHLLTNWDQYVPGVVANASPIQPHTLMLVVGVIEVAAGIGVWFKPKIFAYIVAVWLVVIIINLLLIPGYFDIALRDFGLFLAALALAKLSQDYARS